MDTYKRVATTASAKKKKNKMLSWIETGTRNALKRRDPIACSAVRVPTAARPCGQSSRTAPRLALGGPPMNRLHPDIILLVCLICCGVFLKWQLTTNFNKQITNKHRRSSTFIAAMGVRANAWMIDMQYVVTVIIRLTVGMEETYIVCIKAMMI